MPTSPEATGEHADTLRAAADAYDIQYDNLDTKARISFQQQERALKAYATTRSDMEAANVAGVHRTTVLRWKRENYLRYRDRLFDADATFVTSLEKRMWDRIGDPTGNRGSDILLMFALKAHAPGVYRELPAMDDETAKETLAQLRKLSKTAHSNEKRL
jgi:hypothetical protein